MQPPPPPYNVPPSAYPPPPPRRGMPVWGWVLIGCIPVLLVTVAIVAAILFPVFAKARESARRTSCMSNEKELALGLAQYTEDYDEHFPSASDWMDKTNVYVRNDAAYHCPSVSQADSSDYGYAYNSALGDTNTADISAPNSTQAVYDSTDLSRNANDALTSLPSPGRHTDMNDIAYADGHVDSVGGSSP